MSKFEPISSANENALAITKAEIVKLRTNFDTDIDVKDEIKYTDEQIERLLKKLPVAMYQAAEDVVLRLMEHKEAKRALRKVTANEMSKARLDPELTAAPDRKARAENSQEVEDQEIVVINSEAEYRMAEYRLQGLDNLFTAIKKLSAMRIEQNKAVREANK